jgi:FecR protein
MRLSNALIVATLFATAAFAAAPPSPAGRVIDTLGNAKVAENAAKTGAPVQIGDALVTGADGAERIRLSDDTLILLGSNSRFSVDRYQFQPGAADQSEAHYVLSSGTVRIVSGVMTKLKPGAVSLTTPYGEIKPIGTDYIVGVCSENCGGPAGLYVNVRSGKVQLDNGGGSRTVSAGDLVHVATSNGSPVPPAQLPTFMQSLTSGAGVAGFAEVGPRVAGVINGPVGADVKDYLGGITDTPASPSQPSSNAGR